MTDVRTWTEHVHVYVLCSVSMSLRTQARRLLLDLTCCCTAVQCSEWYDCCLVLVVESTRYDHRQTGETYFEVTVDVRLRVIASFQIKDGLLFWDEGQTRLHFPRVLGTIFHLYR